MKFTVIWKPKSERGLASIWIAADDRAAVTAAANEIDRVLRSQPLTAGESRSGNIRILVVPPLAVHYEVLEEDRLVNVVTVSYRPPEAD
jgi:hypothetical protein